MKKNILFGLVVFATLMNVNAKEVKITVIPSDAKIYASASRM